MKIKWSRETKAPPLTSLITGRMKVSESNALIFNGQELGSIPTRGLPHTSGDTDFLLPKCGLHKSLKKNYTYYFNLVKFIFVKPLIQP